MLNDRLLPSLRMLVLVPALACAAPPSAPAPQAERTTASASTSASASAPPPPPAILSRSRELAKTATFGDLVASAAALEGSERHSDARCALREKPDGTFRLEADLVAPVATKAPENLDTVAPVFGRNTLLTPTGNIGSGGVELVTLSPLPWTLRRQGVVSVLTVTAKGVYYSVATSEPFGDPPAVVVDDTSRERIKQLMPNASAVVVTAERGVPLSRVRDVLRWTDAAPGPVVLGAFGTGDDRAPAAWRKVVVAPFSVDGPERCVRGEFSMTVPGRYDAATLQTVSERIRQDAASCLAKLPADALGGRVTVSLAVGKKGSVTDACLVEDETQNADVRACVLSRARGLKYPASKMPVGFSVQIRMIPPFDAARGICK